MPQLSSQLSPSGVPPARSGSHCNQSGDTGEQLGRLHRVLPSAVPGVPVSHGSDGGGSPVGGVGATWERVGGGGHPTALVGCCCACCCTCGACSVCPCVGMWMGGLPGTVQVPSTFNSGPAGPTAGAQENVLWRSRRGAQRASAEPNLSCSPPAAARGLPGARQAARLLWQPRPPSSLS